MKKTALILLILLVATQLAGCANVRTGNPTADGGLAAFNTIVAKNKDRKGFHGALMHWGLSLPGGDKFEWTKDTSANEIDFAMVMAAEPFIRAGLSVGDLPSGGFVYSAAGVEDGMEVPELLIHPFNVSDKKETAQGSEDALRRILKQSPALVSHDADAQLYTLALSPGFEVKWTEALGETSADILFAIAADPLIAAGVNATKLLESGWVYREASGAATTDQFVKTYTLPNEK